MVQGGSSHTKQTQHGKVSKYTTHALRGITSQVASREEKPSDNPNTTSNSSGNWVANTADQKQRAVDREDLKRVLCV